MPSIYLTPEILQISAIAVIFIYFVSRLFDLAKNWLSKKNGITTREMELFERLTAVETSLSDLRERFDNHIHKIYEKIDELKDLFIKNHLKE